MTKKNDSFNFLPWVVGALAIVAILLIIRNTDQGSGNTVQEDQINSSTNNTEPSKDEASKENEESAVSVAFLKLEQEQLDSLPKEMANLYTKIIRTQNFASGISIFPLMKSLNALVDKEFEKYEIEPIEREDELLESMDGLKVNPRVTADHLNNGGRVMLQKLYLLQEKAYPKLANQLREIKAALSELPSSGNLEGYGFRVKEFFDESFVFFYLAWEAEGKVAS
jgi:hypothetical protein